VTAFIDQHRGQFGVERVCRTLGVSASAYHHRKTGARSVRVIEDERLTERIRELHLANYEAYGYRRMHAALTRAGERVSRDRVARLMRREGIVGAKHRGKPWRTTIPDLTAVKRPDLVKRDFTARAPDRLWVGDFTYLRTWEGRVFFSFILDAGGSPVHGTVVRVDSSPDNAGTGQHRQMVWVRQAIREGVREKPATESSSREPPAPT
jgi:putative transposase